MVKGKGISPSPFTLFTAKARLLISYMALAKLYIGMKVSTQRAGVAMSPPSYKLRSEEEEDEETVFHSADRPGSTGESKGGDAQGEGKCSQK